MIHNLPNSTSLHEDTNTEELLLKLIVTDSDSASVSCSFASGNSADVTSKFRIRLVEGTNGMLKGAF